MRFGFALTLLMLNATGCSTSSLFPEDGDHPRNPDRNGCTFDSQCTSGHCEFGECSPFPRSGGTGADSGVNSIPDSGPKMVLPATGGSPVMGIPTGGGMYLPTTGGAPVMGTPLEP